MKPNKYQPEVVRTASLLIEDADGKIMVQQRDGGKNENGDPILNPFRWCMFGGGIKEGETSEQAMLREVGEELTIRNQKTGKDTGQLYQPSDYRQVLTMRLPLQDGRIIEYNVFHTRENITEDYFYQHEGKNRKFMYESEMEEYDFEPKNKMVIRESLRQIRQKRGRERTA